MYVEICTTPHSRKDPRRAFKRFPSVIRTGKNMYRIQAEDRKLRKNPPDLPAQEIRTEAQLSGKLGAKQQLPA